jgi:hypothetical protein
VRARADGLPERARQGSWTDKQAVAQLNAVCKPERFRSAKQAVHLEMRTAFGKSFNIEATHPGAGQQVHQAQVQGRANRLPRRGKVHFGSGLKRVSTVRHLQHTPCRRHPGAASQHDDVIFTRENKQICTRQV